MTPRIQTGVDLVAREISFGSRSEENLYPNFESAHPPITDIKIGKVGFALVTSAYPSATDVKQVVV